MTPLQALYYLFYDAGDGSTTATGTMGGTGSGSGPGRGRKLTVLRARALARGVVESLLVALASTLGPTDTHGDDASSGSDTGACVEALCGALASVTDRCTPYLGPCLGLYLSLSSPSLTWPA